MSLGETSVNVSWATSIGGQSLDPCVFQLASRRGKQILYEVKWKGLDDPKQMLGSGCWHWQIAGRCPVGFWAGTVEDGHMYILGQWQSLVLGLFCTNKVCTKYPRLSDSRQTRGTVPATGDSPQHYDALPPSARNTYEPLTKLRLLGVEKMCRGYPEWRALGQGQFKTAGTGDRITVQHCAG